MTFARGSRLLLVVLVLPVLFAASGQAQAQGGPLRVGLVVQYEPGNVTTQCVQLNDPGNGEVYGYDVLIAAGLDLSVDASNPLGTAICRINGTGCSFQPDPCFCQCMGASCFFWSYWYVGTDGAWVFSGMGTSNRIVHAGDVEGWVWGAGTQNSGTAPPAYAFDEICLAEAEPTATATATDTSQPVTEPSNTPLPTDTPLPTMTWTPQPSFTAPATFTTAPSQPVGFTRVPAPTPPRLPTALLLPTATRGPATPTPSPVFTLPPPTPTPIPSQYMVILTRTPTVAATIFRPTRSGPTPTPILQARLGTLQPAVAKASATPPAAESDRHLMLFGAAALVAVAAGGGTLLVLRRWK